MDAKEYETIYAVEDRHWWYAGMQRITTTLVSGYCSGLQDLEILDAGCGTGAAMGYLAPLGTVTGCDLSALALSFCQKRGLTRLGQASVISLPFAGERFDLVASFDVLYHRAVDDYRQALREFHRVLKPGGHLFLRLPAYNWLRGRHDEVIHTGHRFTAPELRRALAATGFAIDKLSYANTLLFPLALIKRLAERIVPRGTGSDMQPNPPWLDAFLARPLYLEARWLSRHTLPFGLSVLGIGRKIWQGRDAVCPPASGYSTTSITPRTMASFARAAPLASRAGRRAIVSRR
jgi:SAM-dependent methyltransferase